MVKKTGLGKGLDALFSMPVVEEETKHEGDGLKTLKLVDIEPNREQPRKNFDEESIAELSESIKMYGVIQPIVVTKKEGYYAIIAGERRWRAAKKAGLTEIPAIIREDDEKKNKEISLIENMQREDLNKSFNGRLQHDTRRNCQSIRKRKKQYSKLSKSFEFKSRSSRICKTGKTN